MRFFWRERGDELQASIPASSSAIKVFDFLVVWLAFHFAQNTRRNRTRNRAPFQRAFYKTTKSHPGGQVAASAGRKARKRETLEDRKATFILKLVDICSLRLTRARGPFFLLCSGETKRKGRI